MFKRRKKEEEPILSTEEEKTGGLSKSWILDEGCSPSIEKTDLFGEISGEKDSVIDNYHTALFEDEVKKKSHPWLINLNTNNKYEIDKPEFTVGAVGCDLILRDKTCSRKHATFFTRDNEVFILDHSSNGTYLKLNPEEEHSYRLRAETLTEVKSGQVVIFAKMPFVFMNEEDDE